MTQTQWLEQIYNVLASGGGGGHDYGPEIEALQEDIEKMNASDGDTVRILWGNSISGECTVYIPKHFIENALTWGEYFNCLFFVSDADNETVKFYLCTMNFGFEDTQLLIDCDGLAEGFAVGDETGWNVTFGSGGVDEAWNELYAYHFIDLNGTSKTNPLKVVMGDIELLTFDPENDYPEDRGVLTLHNTFGNIYDIFKYFDGTILCVLVDALSSSENISTVLNSWQMVCNGEGSGWTFIDNLGNEITSLDNWEINGSGNLVIQFDATEGSDIYDFLNTSRVNSSAEEPTDSFVSILELDDGQGIEYIDSDNNRGYWNGDILVDLKHCLLKIIRYTNDEDEVTIKPLLQIGVGWDDQPTYLVWDHFTPIEFKEDLTLNYPIYRYFKTYFTE